MGRQLLRHRETDRLLPRVAHIRQLLLTFHIQGVLPRDVHGRSAAAALLLDAELQALDAVHAGQAVRPLQLRMIVRLQGRRLRDSDG